MIEQFEPDTIVRITKTGEFARILRRCTCGSNKAPLHYEVEVDREGLKIIVVYHYEVELECLPKNVFK